VSFDRIAPHYRWLERLTFGSTLQQARTRWIERISPPKRALILGEGDGRFLCQLLRAHPNVVVDCVDASARMLNLARERVSEVRSQAQVRFLNEDILSWSPSGSYDLIVTSFVLDCFAQQQLAAILRKLADAASAGAHLFLADFAIPRSSVFRIYARFWLAIMYWFFRWTTGISAKELIDPTPELEKNGFRRLAQADWRFGLVKSELWQREVTPTWD
jgi:ubiquinone/menaquinone biosynthesis C-methylase UbiE